MKRRRRTLTGGRTWSLDGGRGSFVPSVPLNRLKYSDATVMRYSDNTAMEYPA